jgi:cytochrome c oxidase subunit IV
VAGQSHSTSPVPYFYVFGALMVFTFLTWWVATMDLGWANNAVAMAIAVTKAVLVVLIFMHVRHSTRLTALTALAGVFWLAILIVITMSDYLTRETLFPFPGK